MGLGGTNYNEQKTNAIYAASKYRRVVYINRDGTQFSLSYSSKSSTVETITPERADQVLASIKQQ